jgi:glycosyltransferase involved in cell wall biosynthesis
MRILITVDPEIPVPPELYGGIERIVDILVRGLRKRGHDVGLVANGKSTTTASELFPWWGRRSQNQLDILKNTALLWSVVRRFRPDIIHSFSRIFYLLPWLGSPLPKIMSYQRDPSYRTTSWAVKLSRNSLKFTGCSRYICDVGKRSGGNWYPIHNCVELEKYTFNPTVSQDAPLVFLSRVEKIKGAHTAIQIALKTGQSLIIAGNHNPDDPYWQREILPHLSDRGQIQYIGTVNDQQKNHLLGQAKAMIVPIEWEEPFGIVFAEALACGTPVISCPRGALPEIVRPGVDGYLINSIEEGCQAVERLNHIQRVNCRQRVEEYFASDVIVEQYEQLYSVSLS